jgi:hypothetical protein
MGMHDKDAIVSKYSEFTPENAKQIAKEQQAKLVD